MGNLSSCLSPEEEKNKPSKRLSNTPSGDVNSSNRGNNVRSSKKEKFDDSTIQEQAIAAVRFLQESQQQNSNFPFQRSTSLRYPTTGSNKKQHLPRSSSSRARSATDSIVRPHQLVHQEIKTDDLETDHFVLVHGGGFGAWCWYRTIALLEEAEYKVDAIDLIGSGVNSFDTNNITSLAQYVQPLTDFLENLGNGEKVILVGHDFGGACISYAMEKFPTKVAKAVFIAAAMLTSGHSTLDMFTQQVKFGMEDKSETDLVLGVLHFNVFKDAANSPTAADSNDLMREAQLFVYANGTDLPPTAIDLDKSLLRDLLFNESTAKDVALASVSMRPIPFAPVLEKLSLSARKYGSVRRFYIETTEDEAIPLFLQQIMINLNPPEKVFRLKGSDHSPFFSKPQALHKLLVEISKIPPFEIVNAS